MELKEYEVNVWFKVAVYDQHDLTEITVKMQREMAAAVRNMGNDSYPRILPTNTSTTVTESKNK